MPTFIRRFRLLTCAVLVTASTGCTNHLVKELSAEDSSASMVSLGARKQIGHNLSLAGTLRGVNGRDSEALSLSGYRPPNSMSDSARLAQEFRYAPIRVTGFTEVEEGHEAAPERAFSANFSYRSAQSDLLWSRTADRHWHFETGFILR